MAEAVKNIWTDIVTIDTAGIVIKRESGATAGSGIIPDSVAIRAIAIWAVDSSKQFYRRGISADASCNWIPHPTGQTYVIEGMSDECHLITYIKAATGTMQVCIDVKGC